MVEKRTIAEILLVVLFMASLGVNITTEDAADNIYSCDIKTVNDMYCFKLSKLNDDGIQRNCYYNKESSRKYKVCSTGWEKITLEEAIKKEPEVIYKEQNIDTSQWICSPNGCEVLS